MRQGDLLQMFQLLYTFGKSFQHAYCYIKIQNSNIDSTILL